MATVQASAEQRFVLYGVSWPEYGRMLRAFAERPAVRLTYDRGTLEIMTLSHEHENRAHMLGRLIVALTEELDLPVKGGGSTTFRRRRRRRGLEPDECYWITSEPQVRGKLKVDLRLDPPPDLVLEIDISRSSLDRMAIYASLGVPEVWRYDVAGLTFFALGADNRYAGVIHSRSFPQVSMVDLLPFMALSGQMDENAIIREFRTWIRQHLAQP
jgi:Uma2 family endonuclease